MPEINDLVVGEVYTTNILKNSKGCQIPALYLGKILTKNSSAYAITYRGEGNKPEIFRFASFEIVEGVLKIKSPVRLKKEIKKSEEEYIIGLLKQKNLWNR